MDNNDCEEKWWSDELLGYWPMELGIKKRNLNEEEFILQMLINSDTLDDLWIEDCNSAGHRTRSGRTKKINYFSETRWGRMISNPAIEDPTTKEGREFRRKFRLPFPVFSKIIVPECDRLNVFEVKDEARVRIPTEFKVLICLRILGRGAYHDDIGEMSGSFKSTCHRVFKQFLRNFTPAC